jgi:hypothetical protein
MFNSIYSQCRLIFCSSKENNRKKMKVVRVRVRVRVRVGSRMEMN